MTAAQLALLGGLVIAGSIAAAIHALRPAAPRLAGVLAQLNASLATSDENPTRGGDRFDPLTRWVPAAALARVQRNVGASREDLAVLELAGSTLAMRKLVLGLAGLVTPAILSAVLAMLGISTGFGFPIIVGLGLAAVGWIAPSRKVAHDAAKAREEFRAALTAYLSLVGLERQARGSPTEALDEAARVSGSWPFVRISTELRRAEYKNQQPWEGLKDLGARIGVEELQNLADIVAAAADGAAVFATLLAEARGMRNEELSAQQTRAAVAGERLVLPGMLLAFGFIVMILYPASTRF